MLRDLRKEYTLVEGTSRVCPACSCFLRRRVQLYRISLHRFTGDTLDAIDMHLMSWGNQFSAPGTSAMSGSMFGQACATNAFSVAAIPHVSLLKPVGLTWATGVVWRPRWRQCVSQLVLYRTARS